MAEERSLRQVLERIGAPVADHRPWPRHTVDRAGWLSLAGMLRERPDWGLLGLWGEPDRVHAALRDEGDGEAGGAVAVVSLPCPDGRFPSLSAARPAAIRLERAAHDLFGLVAEGLEDTRPWLDHGRWEVARPLAAEPGPGQPPRPYPFLTSEGEGLHQIPVGPVHAGIIEPGHFRFTANGETVVRLEERLGYVHKGIEGLMRGRPAGEAARLAARISGDSTVAHSLAFARAVEAALDVEIPERAVWLRALMAELERLANHLGDIGAICNDAAFAFLLAELGRLREAVLRAADACFGHRLMMDRVVPGGVRQDLAPGGVETLRALVAELRRRVPPLVAVYDGKTSLQDRTVGTGIVGPELARRFGAGGHVGRASGRGLDARRSPGYPPYHRLEFQVPVLTEGDVNARVWIRIREVEQSLSLVEQILDRMPGPPQGLDGSAPVPLAALPDGRGGEGMALVESFRGEILTWVRVAPDGTVDRCHVRDPSWFQWPLLEAAIEGNIVADFPLCNKSFNCSYSGHDL
ncbi:nickel-dependent hydrogenase large subunit [Azospirillum thermophilum]|uniref:Hydrogenase expression protein HypE n=1 Tax=Azospirillum thermophilum TaxID=2202148 RepID=A0A2S2CXQ5_9PROT|nr:nickel-dependent hydrogenase large subunit [Azospirillum thermophilum]AWK89302.1 hydrogenase expression protein HypE [Azospirillum thermophilum]